MAGNEPHPPGAVFDFSPPTRDVQWRDVIALTAERDRLVAALETYGRHPYGTGQCRKCNKPGCELHTECTCGLDAALGKADGDAQA